MKPDDIKKVFHFNAKKNNDEMKKYLNLNYAIINIKVYLPKRMNDKWKEINLIIYSMSVKLTSSISLYNLFSIFVSFSELHQIKRKGKKVNDDIIRI